MNPFEYIKALHGLIIILMIGFLIQFIVIVKLAYDLYSLS